MSPTRIGLLGLAVVAGCGGEHSRGGDPIARVGDEIVDGAVVRHVAVRDDVDDGAARQRVIEALQLVAQRRERERARAGERPPELPPSRHDQLVRAARARLWLDEVFQPSHGAGDIDGNDPMLLRALGSAEHVHPEILVLCQVVVGPRDPADEDGGAAQAVADLEARAKIADAAWQARARAVADPIARRLRANVPSDDAKPCDLIGRLLRLETREQGNVAVELQGLGGFDLDACARVADDGSCAEPRFAPEWVAAVRGTTRGFVGPFLTRFGLHVVFVEKLMPAQTLDDPATVSRAREAILERWRARELGAELERMQQAHAVQLAAEAAP